MTSPTGGPVPTSSVNATSVGGPGASVNYELPVLPYAGSSGHSGSEASKERADHDDLTGITGRRQRIIIAALRVHAEHGMTWREYASAYGLHHGQASGPLSVLHKEGRIERLANKRNRCHVYVLPEYVHGRETSPYTPQVGSKEKVAALETEVEELVEVIRDLLGNSGYCPSHVEPEAGCAECKASKLLASR